MHKFKKLLLALVFSIMASWQTSAMAAQPFDEWLQGMRSKALQEGVSEQIVGQALSGITPINRVIELDRKQPEGTMTFQRYKKNVVSAHRIEKGQEMMRQHADELARISEKYGVAPQYIVALWGIETNYGQNTGGFDVIHALATLAWDGRRSAFFTKELLHALKILDEKHITLAKMKGSWAGAMGQNQFMPSSFKTFAVDGDSDGHKDIWTNLTDVFSSTANYLSRSGWTEGQRWGRAVRLPVGFDKKMIDLKKVSEPLSVWKKMGITMPDGSPIPVVQGMKASLVAPDGADGPAFLVYDNYRTIMKWNRSTYFATSVGLLADSIAR